MYIYFTEESWDFLDYDLSDLYAGFLTNFLVLSSLALAILGLGVNIKSLFIFIVLVRGSDYFI